MLDTGKGCFRHATFYWIKNEFPDLWSLLKTSSIQKHRASVWGSPEDFEAPTERNAGAVDRAFSRIPDPGGNLDRRQQAYCVEQKCLMFVGGTEAMVEKREKVRGR